MEARKNSKLILAGVIFLGAAAYLASVVPTTEIAWVMGFLLLTIYLFAFEVVAVDVAAILIMVLLGLTRLLAPWMGLEQGLIDHSHLFHGFSSNAVVSIIAVMIIGAGLDKTGMMGKIANFILRVGGTTEARIIPIISGTVGVISSFMQNVGAAALFLPVVSRISARSGLPLSRLLMPMGFCAILGGTLTMVGSSPLILLNDLIIAANEVLPGNEQMPTWSLFSVTPLGLVMLSVGIAYFVIAGRYILPVTGSNLQAGVESTQEYFRKVYGLSHDVVEVVIPNGHELVGSTIEAFEARTRVRIIALLTAEGEIRAGNLSRDMRLQGSMVIGISGTAVAISQAIGELGLQQRQQLEIFAETLAATRAGVAEVLIPPGSGLIGHSPREIWLRKRYGLSLLAIHRGGETHRDDEGIRDMVLQAGDVLVAHTAWDALVRLEQDRDFVVVTSEYPHEVLRPHKLGPAIFFFLLTLGLIIFTDITLSVALLSGAIGMILSRVLSIEEAYQAVSWKTVFLLASLIPLGITVETSGTAQWIAEQTIVVVGDMPIWVIQSALALLATLFTLVMSNVGATVLLVPLAVNIAIGVGGNPAVFALIVAIATSNSFLIPTHQVNALIMGPGGYRVVDFLRAGGIMTVLFLIVTIAMVNVSF